MLVLALASGEGRALALDKNQCVAESDAGQETRLAGKLVAARAHFMACRDAACPKMVRDACAEWFDEVDRAVPTMILAVREPNGRDAVGATISVDGSPVAADGRPVAVDPGTHHLRAVASDGRTSEDDIVARAGEAGRVVTLTLPAPAPRRVTPWPGIAVGIAAGVAWGTFAGFAIEGAVTYGAASSCAPHCVVGAYDASNRWFVAADVALGVAAVATVVSIVLFATHRYSVPVAWGTAPALAF